VVAATVVVGTTAGVDVVLAFIISVALVAPDVETNVSKANWYDKSDKSVDMTQDESERRRRE
jgi:uncharacterized membrane protein